VIRAWNLLGGEIRWEALAVVADLVGVEDLELLLLGLEHLRRETKADQ